MSILIILSRGKKVMFLFISQNKSVVIQQDEKSKPNV